MKKIKPQFFLIFLFFTVLIVFADNSGFLSPVRTVFGFVFRPVEQVAYSGRNFALDSVSFLTFWKSGEARIKNLEQRNLELLTLANKTQSLERENFELKKQLNVGVLSQKRRLPAEVLGVGRFMTLNRGKKDGVKVGQTVVYLDNFVGQIIRVDQFVSFVQLSTDADLKIPIKVGVLGEIQGVTLGQFNSTIILDQVSQDEEIKNDDLIITSGEGGKIAPDLLVGKIGKITSNKTDLFQRAEVHPLILFDKLKIVFVLTE